MPQHGPGALDAEEIGLRATYLEDLTRREGASRAVRLVSRDDLRFEDGFGEISFDPPGDIRAKPLRFIGSRAHLQLKRHGDSKMHLVVAGWVNLAVIMSRPVLTVRCNGSVIASDLVTTDGGMGTDVVITPDQFGGREWADIYLQLSAVGFGWSEPPYLKVALITDVAWTESR